MQDGFVDGGGQGKRKKNGNNDKQWKRPAALKLLVSYRIFS
jgi:hypothetical protein